MTVETEIQTWNDTPFPLGRHKEHDERSRGFAMPRAVVDRSTWRDKEIRIYDPIPNPNQPVGNCTCCAKAMQLNSIGNRKRGRILDMDWALVLYADETANDEFPGAWLPDGSGQDTGSSGLASCKAAQRSGEGGAYLWEFGGADGVVQRIMGGHAMSLGTRWDNDMFHPDSEGVIKPGGGVAGGHQYIARGYDKSRDRVEIRCWWGRYRDVWIARTDLDTLLRDGGDAHWQATA